MTKTVRVDIVSDVVCPWCLIGWERLKRAAADLEGEIALEIRWLPFELNPQMASEGVARKDYLGAKFGPARLAEMEERLSGVAASEGIAMQLDRISRQPRTLDAHRLIAWAQAQDRGTAMSEALFSAYFARGLDVGDRTALADVAAEIGLDRQKAADFLASTEEVAEVRNLEEQAQRIGIQGVPFYILDQRLGVSGAQPPEAMTQALRQAAAG